MVIRSLLPFSMETTHDPKEPVLLIALTIMQHAKLCLSVIMFLICVCWHPERMCRALSTCGQRGPFMELGLNSQRVKNLLPSFTFILSITLPNLFIQGVPFPVLIRLNGVLHRSRGNSKLPCQIKLRSLQGIRLSTSTDWLSSLLNRTQRNSQLSTNLTAPSHSSSANDWA